MEHLPNDPVMLFSYINTQLRDNYLSLEELCRSLQLSQESLCKKLSSIGYFYNEERNQFI